MRPSSKELGLFHYPQLKHIDTNSKSFQNHFFTKRKHHVGYG
ncbi:hypothetical protein HMPREF0731_0628 [Pseudoroseomonas cervicalis ATCC 49957]|uniref:Uncharacterized protein n=1 Tax=Pseudoroseomonas cervicalis ATCC 49957 TaxID=525371 RepID=D5RHR8_9PROT|nr:hypothetical protein HMPREF0731_0628 [Pseudoroseomonas cervicalis ATCC 49957]